MNCTQGIMDLLKGFEKQPGPEMAALLPNDKNPLAVDKN